MCDREKKRIADFGKWMKISLSFQIYKMRRGEGCVVRREGIERGGERGEGSSGEKDISSPLLIFLSFFVCGRWIHFCAEMKFSGGYIGSFFFC